MTALGIMTHHPELNSVACLMGSGYFRSLSQTLFPSPDFDVDSLNEWDVSHQLASLPGGRYCSGMAMPMTWCRRKKPFD